MRAIIHGFSGGWNPVELRQANHMWFLDVVGGMQLIPYLFNRHINRRSIWFAIKEIQ